MTLTITIPAVPNAPTRCGSRGMARCTAGRTCVADPENLACSLIADCPGLCAKLDGRSCKAPGEDAGCPEGQRCIDRPGDSCNPQLGGTGCASVCAFLDGRSAAV